jgi:RimJ/RimL family protein N-acetyltransferase
MSFSFDISLKDAHIIQGQRIYLELLLKQEDHKQLLDLCRKNCEGDYIKSLYSAPSESIDFNNIEFQVTMKLYRNKYYMNEYWFDNTARFAKLYYVVKKTLASCIQSQVNSDEKSEDCFTTDNENTEEIIGTFEIYASGSGVEFGLFIDHDHSRQHYGTEVLNTVIDFLKKNSAIKTILWECASDNVGSIGVAKKCGFVHTKYCEMYKGKMASVFQLNI